MCIRDRPQNVPQEKRQQLHAANENQISANSSTPQGLPSALYFSVDIQPTYYTRTEYQVRMSGASSYKVEIDNVSVPIYDGYDGGWYFDIQYNSPGTHHVKVTGYSTANPDDPTAVSGVKEYDFEVLNDDLFINVDASNRLVANELYNINITAHTAVQYMEAYLDENSRYLNKMGDSWSLDLQFDEVGTHTLKFIGRTMQNPQDQMCIRDRLMAAKCG